MSNISVSISTTKHIVEMDGPEKITSDIRHANIPVCVAGIFMGIYGFGNGLEREEAALAEMCKKMAKTVHVNSKNKTIFIGETPQDENTALIDYKDEFDRECEKDFFIQWDLLHCLIMEFNVYGDSSRPVFCIKGFWEKDRWLSLEVLPSSKITIINPRN